MAKKMEKYIENFQELGLGLFVHYGPYVQYKNGEWAMNIRQHDPKEYEKKALELDYSSFDAKHLIQSAKASGARYITFTTRHHDGFSLYDTCGLSDYTVMQTNNGRDIVKEFVDACHENDILPFLYHTTLDWHHPDFEGDFKSYLKYLRSSIEILCRNYGKIGGFWLDGNWSRPAGEWEIDELYGVIRKYQPEAIIINNTGLDEQGVFGHKEIDCVTFEQGEPQFLDCSNMEKIYMGEMCYPLCEHWGIASDINIKSMKQILEAMTSCRKVGGNFLLGIFTEIDGSQPLLHQGYLQAIGQWIEKYKEPFYKAKVCKVHGSGNDFALQLDDKLYLFIQDIGTGGQVNVMRGFRRPQITFKGVDCEVKAMKWMDNNEVVNYTYDQETQELTIDPQPFYYGESWIVRVAEVQL